MCKSVRERQDGLMDYLVGPLFFYSVCVNVCEHSQDPAGGHQEVRQGSPEINPTPINLQQFDLDSSLKINCSQFNIRLYLAEGQHIG